MTVITMNAELQKTHRTEAPAYRRRQQLRRNYSQESPHTQNPPSAYPRRRAGSFPSQT